MEKCLVVVGGGPAGMMAAYVAAKNHVKTILCESNVRLGKKMLITGKGRCNITNDVSVEELVKAMTVNGKFLYGAFSDFTPRDIMAWCEAGGVPLKVERGKRVFPVSDNAGDVVQFLERQVRKAGVNVEFNARVQDIIVKNGQITGVKLAKKVLPCQGVVLATGGLSYPATGSRGDGHRLAEKLGHKMSPTYPALVPLIVTEDYVGDLEGLSLRNAELTLKWENKILGKSFGEMVFTAFGLSGPVVLTLSHIAGKHFLTQPHEPLTALINFKPALTLEQLDARLRRDFDTYPKRNYSTLLQELLPKKLIPTFVALSGIDPWKQGHQLNRGDRQNILRLMREFTLEVKACGPLSEAIVTAGGVSVKEIDPKTMGSKVVKGLFFAGELMDIHGVTGGFNMQAALSSGYRSGGAAAAYIREVAWN